MPAVKTSYKGQDVIVKDPIKALRGSFKGKPSLTKALIKERKEEREREDKKS